MSQATAKRENWSGSLGFILATAGSAVGLGNIWKFPYVTGENGGAAFVFVYIICVFIVGLPIMIGETLIGRHSGKSGAEAFQRIAQLRNPARFQRRWMVILTILLALGFFCLGKIGLGLTILTVAGFILFSGWGVFGWIIFFSCLLISGFYVLVGGWTLAYFVKGITQTLTFVDAETAERTFAEFTSSHIHMHFYQILFTALCGGTIWFGVRAGIERASKFLLPLLFLLLLVLVGYACSLDGAKEGLRFFLHPDFSKLTGNTILAAMGQAFFSLSVGAGIGIAYGSYLESDKDIVKNCVIIVLIDTVVAFLAGLAIFPAVFTVGLESDGGPGLAFQAIPLAFNLISVKFGWCWCSAFFLLLFIAAFTSAISLIEVCVCFLIDSFHFKRRPSTLWITVAIMGLGILNAISLENWDRVPPLGTLFQTLFHNDQWESFFSLSDDLTSNYLLPFAGLGATLLISTTWGTAAALQELSKGSPVWSKWAGPVWSFFIRYLVPIWILLVALHSTGYAEPVLAKIQNFFS